MKHITFENFKKLPLSAKIRTVIQLLAYVNQVLILFADLPFAQSFAYQIVSLIVTIFITLLGYWYNNDWSNIARASSEVYDIIKDGTISTDEIQDYISKKRSIKK